MSSESQEHGSLARRYQDLRRVKPVTHAPVPQEPPEEVELAETPADAYSFVSPDRHQKLMLELRLANGNAKALAYSYLVSIDFEPALIRLDFTSCQIALHGRNLRTLFDGLLSQRVARIQEIDPLHADTLLAESDTAITQIDIEKQPETGAR